MSRYLGILPFSGNFEPRLASPLDSRLVVEKRLDLIDSATWISGDGGIYLYLGIPVSVWNDTPTNNGIYILINENFELLSSWSRVRDDQSVDYHASGKTNTLTNKRIGEEKYKSGHRTIKSDIWMDDIPLSPPSSNTSVVKVLTDVRLYPLAGSNRRTWFLSTTLPPTGDSANGFEPDSGWVRNLISPTDFDVIEFGYELKLYNNLVTMPYLDNFYEVDYFSGFVYFPENKQPTTNDITVNGFQYIGSTLGGIGNGLEVSNGIIGVKVDNKTISINTDGELIVNGETVYQSGTSVATSGIPISTGIAIANTPLTHTPIIVSVNGQIIKLGESTSSQCYFSNDGINARLYNEIVVGDFLYFNGNSTGYDLSTEDKILLIYEK